MRIGIDSPTWNATEHVLGEFDDIEMKSVTPAVSRAADAVACWIENGLEKAMNEYNPEPQDDTA